MSHAALATEAPATATLQRACECGGSCASCREDDALQPKLTIGAPGDAYEQEADRIADRIVASPLPANPAPITATPLVQRQEEPMQRQEEDEELMMQAKDGSLQRMEDEEESLQTKPEVIQRIDEGQEEELMQAKAVTGPSPAGGASPRPGRSPSGNAISRAGAAVARGGRPLSPSERAYFEPRFGHDLSTVRLHADATAGQAARSIGARAYTLRNHIAFAPGQLSPETTEGRRLMAHELTHTLQQGGGGPLNADGQTTLRRQPALPVSRIGDSSARIQRQCPPERMRRGAAAGCGVCIGSAPFTGTFVHSLVQYAFFGRYPDMIPPGGSMEFPVPTVPEGETAPFTPKVDLSLITEEYGMRVIYIGELKPFDDAGRQRQAALDKLDDYARELREGGMFDEVRLLERDPPPEFPMIEPFYPPGCPRQQIHICRIQAGVYQYFCAPPWSRLVRDPRCRCTRRLEDEERRRRERRTDEDDRDVEDPIDGPVAPPVAPPVGERRPIDVPETPDVPVPVPAPPETVPETRPETRPEPRPHEPEGPEEEPDDNVIEFPRPEPVEVPVELPIAAMVATAGAVLYSFAKRNAGGPAQKYAQAAAIAVLVVFYSDRVQASPGGGSDPLEAVFDAMTQDGIPVPDELRARLEADPELRAALEQAARSGDLTDAQRAINQQMMDAIAADPDAFSDEDLRMLATASESTSAESATGTGPAPTAETLRRMIDARREGRPITDELPQPASPGGSESQGESEDPAPPATAEQEPIPGVSDALRERLSASPEAERLFRSMIGNSGEGPEVNDEAVRRFLATVPSDLTREEASQLIERLAPARGRSLDEIMSSLARAVEGIRSGAEAEGGGEAESESEGEGSSPDAELETPPNSTSHPDTEEGTTEGGESTTEPPAVGGVEQSPEPEQPTRADLIRRVREFIASEPALSIITPPSGFAYTDGADGTAFVALMHEGDMVAGAIHFTVIGVPTPENTVRLILDPAEMFDASGRSRGTFPDRRTTTTANLITE
ncbi:eCIS core domain-containing protein [Algicella marina]|uniref:DUF4157 domain-containing protein n=1 Tax=Algicella marina TaxID=2683284 RepID=A0A6P1T187_9RHOB|nr:DUF4157 domain-containing protein [Algicella marina]QHQ36674.1 DUF4157 domain-containing protein [Algicella marina]